MYKKEKAIDTYVYVVTATHEESGEMRNIGVFNIERLATALCSRQNRNFRDLGELYSWDEIKLHTEVPK